MKNKIKRIGLPTKYDYKFDKVIGVFSTLLDNQVALGKKINEVVDRLNHLEEVINNGRNK